MQEIIDQLAATVRAAAAGNAPLCIRSGGTKDFYGQQERGRDRASGSILDPSAYAGIVDYEPTELVVTARAGTRLGSGRRRGWPRGLF